MTLRPTHEIRVRTATELTDLWRELMGPGGFGRRTLWLIFVLDGGELSPAIFPIEDVPEEPDAQFVNNLARIVEGVLADQSGTVAFLLSRPGERIMRDSDRRWARRLRDALDARLSPWPVHLATEFGVQVFAPDDLVAA